MTIGTMRRRVPSKPPERVYGLTGGVVDELNERDKNVDFCWKTMEKETQISALVSPTTTERLDRHVRATGVKKRHLVEQARRHHLLALAQLPADIVVHPKLV